MLKHIYRSLYGVRVNKGGLMWALALGISVGFAPVTGLSQVDTDKGLQSVPGGQDESRQDRETARETALAVFLDASECERSIQTCSKPLKASIHLVESSSAVLTFSSKDGSAPEVEVPWVREYLIETHLDRGQGCIVSLISRVAESFGADPVQTASTQVLHAEMRGNTIRLMPNYRAGISQLSPFDDVNELERLQGNLIIDSERLGDPLALGCFARSPIHLRLDDYIARFLSPGAPFSENTAVRILPGLTGEVEFEITVTTDQGKMNSQERYRYRSYLGHWYLIAWDFRVPGEGVVDSGSWDYGVFVHPDGESAVLPISRCYTTKIDGRVSTQQEEAFSIEFLSTPLTPEESLGLIETYKSDAQERGAHLFQLDE
ncbi:hypothetical protein KQI84_09670 [bacterium]|nr:hypothetical protein [bacterium]